MGGAGRRDKWPRQAGGRGKWEGLVGGAGGRNWWPVEAGEWGKWEGLVGGASWVGGNLI